MHHLLFSFITYEVFDLLERCCANFLFTSWNCLLFTILRPWTKEEDAQLMILAHCMQVNGKMPWGKSKFLMICLSAFIV